MRPPSPARRGEAQAHLVETFENANIMAIVGGLGERLFPILQQHYGDFVALPKFEPLHGAVILAKQNFA